MVGRTKHRIVNRQAQPVQLSRVASPALLIPRRYPLVLVQGSNAALEYIVPPEEEVGTITSGSYAVSGQVITASSTDATGTILTGSYAVSGQPITGDDGSATFFLSQELDAAGQALGQSTNARRGQSFEVASPETLNVVAVKLTKEGSPADDITLEIQSNSSDRPSGTVLETASTVSGATLTSTSTWYDFTLDAPLALSASTQYWIVVGRSGATDNTNFYRWRRSPSADVVAAWLTSIETTGWSAGASSWDLTFRLS